MKYYICAKPCCKMIGRQVYHWVLLEGEKPYLSKQLSVNWLVLNEQEREIYREYMVKEGYKYEDC